jgi:hypothetical protein
MSLPHREVHRQAAAPQVGVVDDVVVDQRRGVDKLDHRGVADRLIAVVAGQPRGHQQQGGPHPFAAAGLDVAADLGDQLDLRVDLPREFDVDLLQVRADRLEDLRECRRRLFHS